MMSSDMLSQAEIDALLNGPEDNESNEDTNAAPNAEEITFAPEEADALGEVGNISMGTSATTLSTLLGQKVLITTPKVTVTSWRELANTHTIPYVAVRVEYTKGLEGSNLLILKGEDAKVITDLMMGGDGKNTEGELNDLHLSAIGEAMNQMIGSAATSMSSMFDKKIDISPPKAVEINFRSDEPFGGFDYDEKIVQVAFRMVVGELIDSEIMQLLPLPFAKELVNNLLQSEQTQQPAPQASLTPPDQEEQERQSPQQQSITTDSAQQNMGEMAMAQKESAKDKPIKEPINVQPVQFQTFGEGVVSTEKENINLIMDVPLEVTVELGKTQRLIRDILEFAPGSIIELDKLAGEPIDILVNGKVIAKGEVVVIDESFGVRITDIVNPSRRI